MVTAGVDELVEEFDIEWIDDAMAEVCQSRTVDRKDWDAWLDPATTDAQLALRLLHPRADISPVKVSRAVSSVTSDGPDLISPLQ